MIITNKGYTEPVRIYEVRNKKDMDELSAFIGSHNSYYNNNAHLVIETTTEHYIRLWLNGKYALCSISDAATIELKKKKRGKSNLQKLLSNYTSINALVKTNVPGFKQWCNVASYTTTHGKRVYHIINKNGRVMHYVPLKDTSTGRIFTTADRITAVKGV